MIMLLMYLKLNQNVYRYSHEMHILLTHKENIKYYFFISLNLNTGEILQIYTSWGQSVQSNNKLSETELEELAIDIYKDCLFII